MEDIQKKVLAKAVAMLQASGVRYKVITSDGMEFGDLECVLPKERKKYQRSGIKYQPMFFDQVSKIEPGPEIHVIPVPPDVNTHAFRASLSSYCCHSWGSDSHSTEVKGVIGPINAATGGIIHLMRWV